MKTKSNSKLRVLLVALITIALCVTLITASTFALFTDSVKIKNHLNAGNLKATLIRTAHSYSTLDEDGFLKTEGEDSENVDATTLSNAFDLPDGALVVPGSSLSATFEISNLDTVAFKYSIEIIAVDDQGTQLGSQNTLLSQLTVTLTDSEGTNTLASDATKLEVDGIKVLRAKKGDRIDSEVFTVEIEFVDNDSINNDAQGKGVYLDIIVNAVQVTEASESESGSDA